MVKLSKVAVVMLVGCFGLSLHGQSEGDRERRLTELERKIRQLDPTYVPPASAANFDQRLQELERVVDRLLAASQQSKPATDSVSQTTPVPEDTTPLQTVSVTGDYQASGEGETRLPVAGYMEAHFNK